MVKFSLDKRKKDSVFALLSLFLAAILLGYLIYALKLLISDINNAVNINLIKKTEIARFNFNKFEQLKKK